MTGRDPDATVVDVAVTDDFLAEAAQLRAAVCDRFSFEALESPTRFVWDWFHVSDRFTYLRSPAAAFFPESLHHCLVGALQRWGHDNLGCADISDPWLSVYVEGCRQEPHADAAQGPWAYVLSLTDWARRPFFGGETVLYGHRAPAIDLRDSPDVSVPTATLAASDGRDVEPFFNRLTVFDAGMLHGVRPVRGCLDPAQARIAVHGWYEWPRLTVETGAYRAEDLAETVAAWSRRVIERSGATHVGPGLMTARIDIGDDGAVADFEVVAATSGMAGVREALAAGVAELTLPPGGGRLLVPLRVAAPA
jgi:hypothetical protein